MHANSQAKRTLPRGTMPEARAGFTLVELLVVVSIVALLMAILLPVLGGAKEAGRVAVCLSNQRQQVIAITSYSTSERGYYPIGDMMGFDGTPAQQPRAHRWYIAVGPYLHGDGMPPSSLAAMANPPVAGMNYSWDYNARGRVLVSALNDTITTWQMASFGKMNAYTCPSTRGFVQRTTLQVGPFHGGWDADYRINGCVTGVGRYFIPYNTWAYPPIRNLKQPAAAWALMDGDSWLSQNNYASYGQPSLGVGKETTGAVFVNATHDNAMHNTRHGGGDGFANLTFFDGHGETSWTYPRIGAVSYGADTAARNRWWRGDPAAGIPTIAVPF